MSAFVAALPMYDWPEAQAETDAQWTGLRDALRRAGVDAPDRLTRRNADMPAVPGGIRDRGGTVIAPDPATLPPDELDFQTLWRHPQLLLAQTCWGPLEMTDLASHVRVVGQPDYSAFEGGEGELYSSAIVMRTDAPCKLGAKETHLPLDLMRGKRLAFNSDDSMSGIIALTRDLEATGHSLDIFAERIETGGHRASVVAVAEGRADVAAIDCHTWAMMKRFEPRSGAVHVVGWTARRKGLPFVTSRHTPMALVDAMRRALDSGNDRGAGVNAATTDCALQPASRRPSSG